jgi:hypothetical protein
MKLLLLLLLLLFNPFHISPLYLSIVVFSCFHTSGGGNRDGNTVWGPPPPPFLLTGQVRRYDRTREGWGREKGKRKGKGKASSSLE